MKRYITCPVKGCLAKLTYQENPETGRVLGATACSLIEGEVDCEQECVRLINIGRRHEEGKAEANP